MQQIERTLAHAGDLARGEELSARHAELVQADEACDVLMQQLAVALGHRASLIESCQRLMDRKTLARLGLDEGLAADLSWAARPGPSSRAARGFGLHRVPLTAGFQRSTRRIICSRTPPQALSNGLGW